ncbi:hypothetical protein GCM10010191_46020 [Actinomadura vinacea]|uniref:Uncharacterized protein n=1 Tax=Actinomadura vinacea TaxID=115336 RepID=A0ABP5WM85_9ACTN
MVAALTRGARVLTVGIISASILTGVIGGAGLALVLLIAAGTEPHTGGSSQSSGHVIALAIPRTGAGGFLWRCFRRLYGLVDGFVGLPVENGARRLVTGGITYWGERCQGQATRHPTRVEVGGWPTWAVSLLMPPQARQRWLDDIAEALHDHAPDEHRELLRDFSVHAPAVIVRSWTAHLSRRRP